MANTLHITDGVTTIDFDNPASAYHVRWGGWAPNVGRISHDGPGNTPPYEDVIEEMEISITGATAAAIMTSLNTLVGLIEQAGRWAAGSTDTAVQVKYKITDSGLTNPLASYILGPPDNGPIVKHPNHFDAIKTGLELAPIILRFKREGIWRGEIESKFDSGVVQESIAAVTFTDSVRLPCPIDLSLRGLSTGAVAMPDCTILISQGGTGHIYGIEGESGAKTSAGNTWSTTVDESANDARSTYVGRITASTVLSTTIQWDIGTTNSIRHNLAAVFAVVRVNAAARTWKLHAITKTGYDHVNGRTYPEVILRGADSVNPQVVFLGYVLSPAQLEGHRYIDIVAEVDSITGSPTFDIDYVAIIGLDNPANRALTVMPTAAATDFDKLEIWHLAPLFSPRSPVINTYNETSSKQTYAAWRGDAYLYSSLTDLSCILLAARGTAWTWTNASNNPIAPNWYFDRTRIYLTPQ